jgi:hypothetical protein
MILLQENRGGMKSNFNFCRLNAVYPLHPDVN